MAEASLTRRQITDEAWRRGFLYHRCHSVQQAMYKTFYESEDNSTLVWLLARQSGKTYLLAILALEQALRQPNSVIKILTDTKIHMETIFIPVMNELLEECPDDVKPEYQKSKFAYTFTNGSQIQLAGSDGKNYERLRGQKSHLCLVDEAGFCDDLNNVVLSVLVPTTTHTGGKTVLASTPPKEFDHEFLPFIEEAEMHGYLTKKTIYDNPLLTATQVERIAEKMGGVHSEQYRREYLCELIKDASTAVLPECTPALLKEITKEWPTPPFFDAYESMDLGFTDLTVVLFAYYDFRADKLIIEDEIVTNGPEMHLNKLTADIKDKERKLWTNVMSGEVKTPYLRVSDINYIATNEIRKNSNNEIIFVATKKDDKDSAINNLRMQLSAKKIVIHPRCVTLLRHMQNVRWQSAKNKTVFARSPDDGHYDAVDALIYLSRSVVYSKNPYPAHYGFNLKDLHIQNEDSFNNRDPAQVYARIFGRKLKRN
jgi:hypothetical protein